MFTVQCVLTSAFSTLHMFSIDEASRFLTVAHTFGASQVQIILASVLEVSGWNCHESSH